MEGVFIMRKTRSVYDVKTVREFVKEKSSCELVATEYIKNTINVKLKCSCGKCFTTSFNDFKNKNKRQCNDCGHGAKNKDTRLTIEFIKDFVSSKSDCKLISERYVGINEFLDFRCACGNPFHTTFSKFKSRNKRQCNECGFELRAVTKRKTKEEFESQLLEMYDNEYSLIGEYTNDFTKVTIKHNECSHVYDVSPSNILKYRRCPLCASSKGEYFINKWLKRNDINFSDEHSFPNLVSATNRVLRFDFAVLDDFRNVTTLIEYDGGQHFKWIKGWQSEEGFKTLQLHDKMKNEYCEVNNIKLLRIPHWEFNNLNNILQDALL